MKNNNKFSGKKVVKTTLTVLGTLIVVCAILLIAMGFYMNYEEKKELERIAKLNRELDVKDSIRAVEKGKMIDSILKGRE